MKTIITIHYSDLVEDELLTVEAVAPPVKEGDYLQVRTSPLDKPYKGSIYNLKDVMSVDLEEVAEEE